MSSRRDELACIGSDLLQASRHIPRQRHPLLCYNNACVCCSCKNLLIHLKGCESTPTRWPLLCFRTQRRETTNWPAKASCKQPVEPEKEARHEPSGETRLPCRSAGPRTMDSRRDADPSEGRRQKIAVGPCESGPHSRHCPGAARNVEDQGRTGKAAGGISLHRSICLPALSVVSHTRAIVFVAC